MMAAAENIADLRSILSIVAEETGALKMEDADEDSVGWTTEGPLPMTFGHVRRAHAALAALEAALSAAEPVAARYDFDGCGFQYIDNGSGSDWKTRHPDAEMLYDRPQQPALSVAVKALEGAFKHFKVVYDPPNGISINEATRAEAIKLAASALYATLSQAEIETLRACEDWKATFEIMRIRRVDKAAEAWRSSQKIVDNLLDRGLLEFGEPNTTYRITDAGRSALSAQVQDVAGWRPIESAPRDGTQFLAFEIDGYFNCWWHDNGYGEQYWMDEADSEPNPTHWMPLPAAPAKQEGGHVTSK